MARTITYRVKSPAGPWLRAVVDDTALPQSITADVVGGTTYEVDTGKGTLVDVTPEVSFTLEVFTGTPVAEGSGVFLLEITSPAYLAAYDAGEVEGAGAYRYTIPTDIASGPAILYPGTLNAETYTDGDSITPGNLPFGVGSQVPTITYRVVSNTPSPNTTVFEGATLNFDLTGREGQSISVLPILTDDNGSTVGAAIATFTVAAAAANVAQVSTQTIFNTGSTASATSYTSAAITPSSGANRLAVLMFGSSATTVALGTLTASWGASSFTMARDSIVTTGTFKPNTAILVMKEADIPASAETITITSSNTNGLVEVIAELLILENVNQTTPTGNNGGRTNTFGTGALFETAIVNMASANSFMVSCAFSRNTQEITATSSGGDIANVSNVVFSGVGPRRFVASREQAAASGNLTHTYTASSTVLMSTAGLEILKA